MKITAVNNKNDRKTNLVVKDLSSKLTNYQYKKVLKELNLPLSDINMFCLTFYKDDKILNWFYLYETKEEDSIQLNGYLPDNTKFALDTIRQMLPALF